MPAAICFVPLPLLALTAVAPAQVRFPEKTTFENRAALVLENDRLELTIMAEGGAFARLVRKDDSEKLSPLWDPAGAARAARRKNTFGSSLGHFVCVDGFGAPSREERAAGYPGHGEAHVRPWEVLSASKSGGIATLTFSVDLPLAHEVFTRTIRIADGENVIQVQSSLESRLAFDRVFSWTEHATIGTPFLEPEDTLVDLPAKRAVTRPAPPDRGGRRRLAPGREFTWPNAPSASGGEVDLRSTPQPSGTGDIVTVLLDPAREYAFVTALHPTRDLVFGYLFPRSDFPWLQIWESYPEQGMMARGLEFGTQPFGQSRRLTVDLHSLLGAPAYRWLPAMSKVETRFLMFYAETPEGFRKVDDVRLEDGQLVLTDRQAGKQLVLAARLGL